MAPNRSSEGERIAGLEAKLDAFERYERDRWHKQDKDLQLLVGLPTQIARENGKMQGEIERGIMAAVEKAIEPLARTLADLAARVSILELAKQREEGAKGLAVWFLQSPLIGWIAAAALFFVGWWKGQGR
jgi:hypothetical protein